MRAGGLIFLLGFVSSLSFAQDKIILTTNDTIPARNIEVTRKFVNFYPDYEKEYDMYSFTREEVAKIIYVDGRVGTDKNNFFVSALEYPKMLRLEHIKSGELIVFRLGDYVSIKEYDERGRFQGEITDITDSSFFLGQEEFYYSRVHRLGQYVPNPRLRIVAGAVMVGVGTVAGTIGTLGMIASLGGLKNKEDGAQKLFLQSLGVTLVTPFIVTKGSGLIIQSLMANLKKGKWQVVTDV